jgi:DNA-binding transcriptional regulator YiaG
MKYLYDSEHDVLTVQFAERKYVESEEVWPGVVVDFDRDGRPIALDFIESASERVDVEGLEEGEWRRVKSVSATKDIEPITSRELRLRREALGLTQAQLGEALDTPPNTIARWERGEITIERPRMIAAALDGLVVRSSTPEKKVRRSAMTRGRGDSSR